mmetsp:Transcript_58698/g.116365  ORF Transcript_58698/g.116365 Transcript_58698/m.116365 type:complete len:188 (+) Transcript_58698:89-652(+)
MAGSNDPQARDAFLEGLELDMPPSMLYQRLHGLGRSQLEELAHDLFVTLRETEVQLQRRRTGMQGQGRKQTHGAMDPQVTPRTKTRSDFASRSGSGASQHSRVPCAKGNSSLSHGSTSKSRSSATVGRSNNELLATNYSQNSHSVVPGDTHNAGDRLHDGAPRQRVRRHSHSETDALHNDLESMHDV